MTKPFINYASPVAGGQFILNPVDVNIYLIHAVDNSGTHRFDVVDAATDEIIRSATPAEVRETGLNPDLFLNVFVEAKDAATV